MPESRQPQDKQLLLPGGGKRPLSAAWEGVRGTEPAGAEGVEEMELMETKPVSWELG